MKKTAILFVITISLILFASTSNAFAKKLEPSLGPYMTDEGSTVKKDVFGWDEKPYVFIQFDVDELNTNWPLFVRWKWKFMGKGHPFWEFERVTDFSDNPLNIWDSLDNWDSCKKVGKWRVETAWWSPTLYNSGKEGLGRHKVNFTVTPEPVSSILFLVGGASLAATRLRRRKK